MPTSRLDDLRMVDPVLTTVAQGYSNAQFVYDELFPEVKVSKLKGKIPVFGRESFIIRSPERAPRAQSNRIPPSDLQFVEFETVERDVEIAIDYLEEEESPDFMRYEQRVTRQLVDILALSKEKQVADYVQNVDNFDSALKTEIDASTAFDDYTNETDPIEVIRDGMQAMRSRIAVYPNTMIIGESVYRILMSHPKITERIKYSGSSRVNTKILSELVDIPHVRIGMSVYTSDGSSFTDIWNDNIILSYSDKSERIKRSEFNPGYGYIFQRQGKPEVDTYYENGGKIKVIRNTDNYALKTTCSDAAYLISKTNHN